MRIAHIEIGGVPRYALVEGDQLALLASDLFAEPVLDGRRVPLSGVRLLPPIIPRTFYAAGLNYKTHLREVAERDGTPLKFPEQGDVGYRAQNAIIAHDEPIIIPHDSGGKLQYEGELVAIIGKKVKHVSVDEALDCVFGYTIGNDVTERKWHSTDRTMWRGKNSDTFKPMGPWIETTVDLENMVTTIRLNGKVVSQFQTNDMIHGVAQYIATMSRYLTLYPGDVLWMGTDEPFIDMVDGDVVEVELSGIGTLRNPVRLGTPTD